MSWNKEDSIKFAKELLDENPNLLRMNEKKLHEFIEEQVINLGFINELYDDATDDDGYQDEDLIEKADILVADITNEVQEEILKMPKTITKELDFEIKKTIGILSKSEKGWTTELNYMIWNGGEPKYDIRAWSPDHTKMGKGITLDKESLKSLWKILDKKFNV